jgi:hypothetical protein
MEGAADMSAKSINGVHRRRVMSMLAALALLAGSGVFSTASALIISGGPNYVLPGGGSCTVGGVSSQTGGATVSCTGVNLAAHTKVYFGIRADTNVNGNTMTGVNPAAASINVFRYSSSTGSSVTYTSTTSVNGTFNATHAVNNQLVLTLTAGSATLVTTGGTPASSALNGDIERLFQITSGSTFSIRADVKASDAFFGLGQACPAVYDPSHAVTGNGGDHSRVDVAFYYSDCGDGVVDAPEECDEGSGVNGTLASCCTAACTFRAAGQVCRSGPGAPCDANELCTGSAADCPADDALINGGNVCRPGSGDLCDLNELCTGVPGQGCPADDAPGNNGLLCRLSTTGDVCDESEECTGAPGATCPADDAPGKLNFVCRPGSGDICDPDERCVGIPGMACPADAVANPSTVCRSGSGDMCDPPEFCTAIPTQPCPANVVQPAGTDCRPAVDTCDVLEECTGVPLQPCPPNGFAPASTSCNEDNDVCTVDECDGSGNCTFDSNLSCDDGNLCSQDTCDASLGCQYSGAPSNSCATPSRALFKYKDNVTNSKDTIKFLWRGGPSLVADMGDPRTTTDYELCVYENGQFRMGMTVAAGAGWSTVGPSTSPKGYKYKDTFAAQNGIKLIKLKASSLDKAKVKVTGKGNALPDLGFNPLPFDFPVKAQLYASDGMCWEAEFGAGETKKNDDGSFIGKR